MNNIFTVHVMHRTSHDIVKAFLSVKFMHCDETRETCAHILIPQNDSVMSVVPRG